MKNKYPRIEDKEIEKAFENTNFGPNDNRKLAAQGLLKQLAGWRSGYTLTCIMKELGFVNRNGDISKKGKMFLYEEFKDSTRSE